MLGHCLVYILVNWQQSLAGSPVHLADELTAECVNDTCNGGGFSLADEIEVEHALYGSWLETINKTSRLVVEECVFGAWAQRSAGCCKTADVVVGRKTSGCGKATGTVCGGRRHFESMGGYTGLSKIVAVSKCCSEAVLRKWDGVLVLW